MWLAYPSIRWKICNNLCTYTIAYSDQRLLLAQLATLPDFQDISCQEKHPHIGMQLPRMFCFTYAVLWVTISKATSHKPQVGKDHVHLKAMLLIKSRAIQHQSNPILFFVFYLFTSRAMTWRSRTWYRWWISMSSSVSKLALVEDVHMLTEI